MSFVVDEQHVSTVEHDYKSRSIRTDKMGLWKNLTWRVSTTLSQISQVPELPASAAALRLERGRRGFASAMDAKAKTERRAKRIVAD